jgi:hypothetical protein
VRKIDGAIATAAIDDDDLVSTRAQRFQRRQPSDDRRLLVEDRHDDR